MEIFAFSQSSVQSTLSPYLNLEELIQFLNTVNQLTFGEILNPVILQKCRTMHPSHVHSLFRQAAGRGDYLIVSTLLRFGNDVAGIESTSEYGYTPLILAAENSRLEIVRLLLKSGANINGRDSYKDTALIAAARFGSASVIRLLLETNVPYQAINLNAQNIYGCTALSQAVRRAPFREPISIVQLLLEAGADPNQFGKTPLSLVRIKRNDQLAQILIAAGAIR